MKRVKTVLSLLLALSLLCFPTACTDKRDEAKSQTFFVMDTFLTVTLYGLEGEALTEAKAATLFKEANQIALAMEKKASRTLEESEVYAFNAATSAYTFSSDMAELLREALALCQATEGAYDITVAPLVELWNVKEGGPVPTQEAIDEALSAVSFRHLTMEGDTLKKDDPRVRIDLGSAAKGYALGKIASFLQEAGAVGTVNFGGNVALLGQKSDGSPWKVSLRDPFAPDRTAGSLALSLGFVAVSGDYERFFEENGVRYHHILSPFDGYPVRGVHSVAIVSDNAAYGDMLSTALFVMGEEKARDFLKDQNNSFAYVMTLSEETTAVSDNAKDIYTP